MISRYREPALFLESGQVLRDVKLPEYRRGPDGQVVHSPTAFDWLVVLSQDCDLERDREDRARREQDSTFEKETNLLRIALVCPAFPATSVSSGTYLLGAKQWGSNERQLLDRDGEDRYHGLHSCEGKFDRLLIDFKLLTGAHPTYLESWISTHSDSAVATLEAPFRDRLIQRFVGYLGRIPEPADS